MILGRAAAVLRRLVGTASPRMVEVGVFWGRLSRDLLQSRADLHLVMVDAWLAAEQQAARYVDSGDYHARLVAAEQAAHRRRAADITEFAVARRQIVCADSVEAAQCFADNSFDMVFLDADHSQAGLARDLDAWAPKVRRGGWLGGHDCDNPQFPGVRAALDDRGAAVDTDEDFTWFMRRP